MSVWLTALAVFMAAGVEWVEALTIVLAVGMVKGWRIAILAAAAAIALLLVLVAIFGLTLTTYISISIARTVVGVGLLLIGLGWLYKAILRSTGLKAQRDEAAEFAETREDVVTHGHAFGTAFAGVFLEGFEVVFIVVALGGLNGVAAAAAGAVASLLVVAAAGVLLRHPLTSVPENLVKYIVGVMLTAFGTFFTGEGLGVKWWQGDIALLAIVGAYAATSLIFVRLLIWRPAHIVNSLPVRMFRSAVLETWGLFVTNGLLAIATTVSLIAVTIFVERTTGQQSSAGLLLVGGVVFGLGLALWAAARTAVAQPTAPHRPANENQPILAEHTATD